MVIVTIINQMFGLFLKKKYTKRYELMKHVRRYSHLTTCSEQMRGICGTTHMHPCHPWVCTSLEFHWIVHGERIPENLAAPVDAMTHIIFLLPSLSRWTSRHLFCPEFQKIDHTISHSECWHYSLCIVSILPCTCSLWAHSFGTIWSILIPV